MDPVVLLTPLVEQSGHRLVSAVREDVAYRPGRDVHVRFAAEVERQGRVRREGWVLHAAEALAAGALVLEGAAGPIAAWRVRDDPALPSLRLALRTGPVSGLLRDLGLPADGLRLTLVTYRPQRRAVVEVTTATHRLFLKCLLPTAVAALHARHAACRAAGLRVPRAAGFDAALGLLVLTPVPGSPLRGLLLGSQAVLPPPVEVVELLDEFARVDLDVPARSPLRQVGGHARSLSAVLPAEQARIGGIVERVRAGGDGEATAVVHGDFYDGQVLVRDGHVTGVVDVDGVGRGNPTDDAGHLLAHLLVMRTELPPTAEVHRWCAPAVAEVEQRHDGQELRRRVTAVMLGLALWPHTEHRPGWEDRTRGRLDLMERVLDRGPATA